MAEKSSLFSVFKSSISHGLYLKALEVVIGNDIMLFKASLVEVICHRFDYCG